MSERLQEYVKSTKIFFLVRLVFSALVGLLYIMVAAGIQYFFVGIMGESTFNYIISGVLSLFLGMIVCHYAGFLVFMFVRGWHMAALAHSKKIIDAGAPALEVGIIGFSKHILSFGAVYGVSMLIRSVMSEFQEKLWDLLDDVPFASTLKSFADNPIVAHLAGDILNYGFDCTIYYLVKYTKASITDDFDAVFKALKVYLCALPSVMVSSLTTFVLLDFLPKVLEWVIVISIIFSKGLVSGILLSVLLYPVFYILQKSVFEPLTMMVMLSCYSAHCKDEIEEDSPAAKFVDEVFNGTKVGTTMDDMEPEDAEPVPEAEDVEDLKSSADVNEDLPDVDIPGDMDYPMELSDDDDEDFAIITEVEPEGAGGQRGPTRLLSQLKGLSDVDLNADGGEVIRQSESHAGGVVFEEAKDLSVESYGEGEEGSYGDSYGYSAAEILSGGADDF